MEARDGGHSQSDRSRIAAFGPRYGAAATPSLRRKLRPIAPTTTTAQVSVYDFKRPERVSKEQMRAFQAMHDGFSREFGAGLSGMLRTIVEVKLSSVDQLTYGEFVFSLENMTCFNVMQAEGLDGHMILDLTPSIIFPIVDRLLGGGKSAKYNIPSRPLTEIELRLISRIIEMAIHGLEKSWSSVCELKLQRHAGRIESATRADRAPQRSDRAHQLRDHDGRNARHHEPVHSVQHDRAHDRQPVVRQLVRLHEAGVDPRQKLNLQTGVGKAKVEMVVGLADTRLTAKEILDLSVGDVIMTEKGREQALDVYVEGRPLFRGSAGLFKGHKAVRVGTSIARPEDLIELQLKANPAATRKSRLISCPKNEDECLRTRPDGDGDIASATSTNGQGS